MPHNDLAMSERRLVFDSRKQIALYENGRVIRRYNVSTATSGLGCAPESNCTPHTIDVNDLRARVRKMTDDELLAFGKSARYMCSPTANLGKAPREPFVIQLREVREEWRRREVERKPAASARPEP